MKRLLLICMMCALSVFGLQAQVSKSFSDYQTDGKNISQMMSRDTIVIFESNFDEATVGQKLGVVYPEFWTTWSNQPGGSEDAVISNDFSNSAPNSAKFSFGNDVVFQTGNKTSGRYTIDFDMYLGTGKSGYFNILHNFAGSSSEWGVEIYFNEPAKGTIYSVGGVEYPFTVPFDTWFDVNFDINLDGDWIQFKINDALIGEWQFSLQASSNATGLRQLAAMDFYPPTNANSLYYIDNFSYTSVGGDAYPDIDVTPTTVSASLAPGQVANQTITISNSGTSIGDYFSWITFDAATGATGTQQHSIAYCSDAAANAVGFTNGTPLVEIGAKFTGGFYGPYMNTEITQLSYFVGSNDITGNYTFRVYGQGTYNVPGEILAEAELTNYTLESWNTVTLPTPVLLNGADVWVTVSFTQIEGTHPISFDDGFGEENMDWYRVNNGSWEQFHNGGGQNYGRITIKATSVGTPIPGTWALLSGTTYGSVLAGATTTYNLALNASGLAQGNHAATLHVLTNNTETPQFDIPITLEVITSDCDVPTNLQATANQNEMSIDLTWEGAFTGGLISWATEEPSQTGIGTGGAFDFSVAHRFEPSDLTPYNGMVLDKIFFPAIEAGCTYSVRVWTGANAANLIVDQEVSNPTLNEMNEVVLNTPVTINAGQELWFGIRCNTTTGHPALCDLGPAVDGKGNMIGMNNQWATLLSAVPDANYNWYLFANVTAPAKGISTILQPLSDNSGKTSGDLSMAKTSINIDRIRTRDVTYNVYRDGTKIAQGLTEMAYTDANLTVGNHCYTVTTSCPAGEGLHSNESCAELLEPCAAPATVVATGESQNASPAIHLTWSAVSGAEKYKVYHNDNCFATVTETEVYVTGISANIEYCFTVRTVCENGLISVDSEPACATYSSGIEDYESSFRVFPNPANNQVKVEGANINQIMIYNMVGQMVETTTETTINTASYNNGVYILRILTNEGNTVTKRVIINH